MSSTNASSNGAVCGGVVSSMMMVPESLDRVIVCVCEDCSVGGESVTTGFAGSWVRTLLTEKPSSNRTDAMILLRLIVISTCLGLRGISDRCPPRKSAHTNR